MRARHLIHLQPYALLAALVAPAYAGSHGPSGFGTPRPVQHGIPLEVDGFNVELQAAWTVWDEYSTAELRATSGSAASLEHSVLGSAALRYGVSETVVLGARVAWWWTEGYAVGPQLAAAADPLEGDPGGPSDLWLDGSWRFHRHPRGDFAFLFGVKLPFGADDERLDGGEAISPSDQASTGAVDFRAGLAWSNQLTDRLRFDASLERTLHGDNNGFEQGDRWDVGASFLWRLGADGKSKAGWSVAGAMLMTNLEADAQAGVSIANSSGTLAWFAPSLVRSSADGSSLRFELALPVSQELDGDQVEADSRLTIGWSRGF